MSGGALLSRTYMVCGRFLFVCELRSANCILDMNMHYVQSHLLTHSVQHISPAEFKSACNSFAGYLWRKYSDSIQV